MVCLGNICRSPTAEAIFRQLVALRLDADDWRIDSCGTGSWHVGKRPDPRALKALTANGYQTEHRARQLSSDDYQNFDWLLGMDGDNLANLHDRQPQSAPARIALLADYDPQGASEVGDPYYGGEEGFHEVFTLIRRCCERFLEQEYPL
jgi:protein-tyrosine-phosphatase